MTKFRRGDEIYIEVHVKDMRFVPATPFDPDGGVKVTIKRPNGEKAVDLLAMTQRSTGIYFYRHQSSVLDTVGAWAMEFKANHTTATHLSLEMGAFELVS